MEFNFEELKKKPILREKWIRRYFMIPINKKLENIDDFDPELQEAQEYILNLVIDSMVLADSREGKKNFLQKILGTPSDSMIYNKTLKKNPVATSIIGSDGLPYFLIRFRDSPKDEELISVNGIKSWDNEKDGKIKDSRDGRSVLFSPLDDYGGEIIRCVEQNLVRNLGFNLSPVATMFEIEKGVPIVRNSDGFQSEEYPLEKRLLLYQAAPEFEESVFGKSFPKFIEWVMEKKNDNKHMKEYCLAVEKILKKNNFKQKFLVNQR